MKKNPLRRLLAPALALCLLLPYGAVGAFAEDTAPENRVGEPYEERIPDEELAEQEAWRARAAENPGESEPMPTVAPHVSDAAVDALYEYWLETPGGHHPAEYAGYWLEGEVLHIALTTDDEAVRQRYLEIMGNPALAVSFHRVAYSLDQLRFYAALAESLVGGPYGASPDIPANMVLVLVDEDAVPAAWDALHAGVAPVAFWGTGVPLPGVDEVFWVQAGIPPEEAAPDEAAPAADAAA